MREARRRFGLIPLIAGIALVTLASRSYAGEKTSASPSPQALELPSSHLHIDDVRVSPTFVLLTTEVVPSWSECVAFTNDATAVATQVLLDFSWSSPDGKKVVDEFYPFGGTFPKDVPEGATLKKGTGICRPTMHEFPEAGLHVFVSNISYQDGTSWHLIPPVAGTQTNAVDSPVVLSNIATYSFSSPIRINARPDYPPPLACADIVSRSPKTISGVQIAFQHFDQNGTLLGADALNIQTRIPSGESVKNNCRGFSGTVRPDPRDYAQRASKGRPLAVPVILYNGRPSTLSATVATVYFSDGTSWHARSASTHIQRPFEGNGAKVGDGSGNGAE